MINLCRADQKHYFSRLVRLKSCVPSNWESNKQQEVQPASLNQMSLFRISLLQKLFYFLLMDLRQHQHIRFLNLGMNIWIVLEMFNILTLIFPRFKVYAPIAFRHFRDLFRIAPDDYLISLCNEPLRELSNPGASGSIFYLTNDDEFIIKTVQHKEAEFLQKLLPGYYMVRNIL